MNIIIDILLSEAEQCKETIDDSLLWLLAEGGLIMTCSSIRGRLIKIFTLDRFERVSPTGVVINVAKAPDYRMYLIHVRNRKHPFYRANILLSFWFGTDLFDISLSDRSGCNNVDFNGSEYSHSDIYPDEYPHMYE